MAVASLNRSILSNVFKTNKQTKKQFGEHGTRGPANPITIQKETKI